MPSLGINGFFFHTGLILIFGVLKNFQISLVLLLCPRLILKIILGKYIFDIKTSII